MQFSFITACRSVTGLLPTQHHGCAVVPAFRIEWHNYMDVTFIHADVCPRGRATASKNIDAIGELKIEAARPVRRRLPPSLFMYPKSIQTGLIAAFPEVDRVSDPTRLWRLALRPVYSACSANIYSNRYKPCLKTRPNRRLPRFRPNLASSENQRHPS